MPLVGTISKSGEVITRFEPSGNQLLFAMNKAKNPHLSEEEVCDMMHMARRNLTAWKTKYGSHFLEWLEEAVDTFGNDQEAKMLEAVGMMQALKSNNYQYWRDMARTKGVIKEEVKTQNITINTDFSQILIGDVKTARERILQELRGVKTNTIEVASEPVVPARVKASNTAV